MYESPVSMTIRRVIEDSKNAIESVVCNAAFEMGIEIDKGELLKALTYDRDQYNNGYADGKADATPKWISVKSKLPPRELKVLAVNGHGYIKILAFWKKEKERWTWIEDSRFTHRNDITHWMPLPKAPEEEC